MDSEWVKPVTVGIGTFKVNLKNAFGQISGKYREGDVAKFFYDNTNATRLQFQGRIDRAKNKMDESGQFLEIVGRHRSYLLAETKINYSAINADPANILIALVAKLPSSYGFTTNNVKTTGLSMSKEWNYVTFWDCVKDLCEFAQADCRVDNDLDFHFHLRDSVINEDEPIVEGQSHIQTLDEGKDDYFKKTRFTATGEDDAGMLIVYTAKSSDEGTEIREGFIKNVSANTRDEVRALAEAKLAEVNNITSQARYLCKGLETLEPGENVRVVIMRQKIYNIPRIVEHKLRFGSRIGGVRSEIIAERENKGMLQIMEDRIRNERNISKAENVNKMQYSYNFIFDDDALTESHSQTEVRGGMLMLSNSAFNNGTWISDALEALNDITSIELRNIGRDILSSDFYFSVNGGTNWEPFIAENQQYSPANTGKSLKLKIQLNKNDSNAWPTIDSSAIYYT